MDNLDYYYRAFKEYRKETSGSTVCEKDRRAISSANTDEDKLESTKYLVTIEKDWIEAIENGLKFVEQAVAEERQFIRTNGEVVPIEKVRKISKDSVVHLAKHSDMITHVPEEEEADDKIVPDRLYMVEKLSDYAVYENRFLYMMLCYIKNFIEYRLEKIDGYRRSYVGDFYVNKQISSKKRTLKIETRIYDERFDNPYPIADSECDKLVKRIGDCREIINSLLNTDLMQQVSKSPMIKPPIVKTNVLKMNNNFKNALALYDYIASYSGNGFSCEEVKYNFAPFSEGLADELAEATNLTSFLAYKAGNKIEDVLEANYRKEEEKRKKEEEKKTVQRLARLKKRALESDMTLEEYMLALEDRNRQLEKDSEELARIREQIEELNAKIDGLNAEKEELTRRCDELITKLEEKEEEIAALKQKYVEDMAALKKEHDEHVAALTDNYNAEITSLKNEFADKLSTTIDDYESRVTSLTAQVTELNARYENAVQECDRRINEMRFEMSDFDAQKQRLMEELEQKLKQAEERCTDAIKAEQVKFEAEKIKLGEEIDKANERASLFKGELDGIRIAQGKMVPSEEFTSRERFTELENEYEAFQKFFKKQWEFTKKEIRKTILWAKNEKKKPIDG